MSEILTATAGIVLFAWDEGVPVALLQRRAEGHSYARSLGQTAHGGAEPSEMELLKNGSPSREVLAKVALRELKEEAGPRISIIVRGIMTRNLGSLERACVNVVESHDVKEQGLSATFLLDTRAKSRDILKLLEPSEEGTGFIAISGKAKLLPLQPGHKVAGAPRGRDVYMRPVDIKMIQEALAALAIPASVDKHFF